MKKQSAGILLYRIVNSEPEFFLVHPGGPFWINKDVHAWTVPKGEFTDDEDPLDAAKREFEEETGIGLTGEFIRLAPVIQKGGKKIYCFGCRGDLDEKAIKSNSFEIEWPPRSGKMKSFPEIDRGAWFGRTEARIRINEAQASLLDEMSGLLAGK